jgi:hypothetical protein
LVRVGERERERERDGERDGEREVEAAGRRAVRFGGGEGLRVYERPLERERERDREGEREYVDDVYEERESMLRESSESECGSGRGFGFGAAFLSQSRMPSVRTPMPIAVKKLMEKRVLLWSSASVGKTPARLSCSIGSLKRATTSFWPRNERSSSKRILMKIRELDVVSSSFSLTARKTCHPMASVANRWAKNWAMMRRRFVSKRWIVS